MEAKNIFGLLIMPDSCLIMMLRLIQFGSIKKKLNYKSGSLTARNQRSSTPLDSMRHLNGKWFMPRFMTNSENSQWLLLIWTLKILSTMLKHISLESLKKSSLM